MGLYFICSVSRDADHLHRFDNSGHKIPFPTWHSNQTNIARTNQIIKEIASMFAGQPNVVPIIAPLNE